MAGRGFLEKRLFLQWLAVLTLIVAGCSETYRTVMPPDVEPAYLVSKEFPHSGKMAYILAVDGLNTVEGEVESDADYPLKAELSPGWHSLKLKCLCQRDNRWQPLGVVSVEHEFRSGAFYRVDWVTRGSLLQMTEPKIVEVSD